MNDDLALFPGVADGVENLASSDQRGEFMLGINRGEHEWQNKEFKSIINCPLNWFNNYSSNQLRKIRIFRKKSYIPANAEYLFKFCEKLIPNSPSII